MGEFITRGLLLGDVVALSARQMVHWAMIDEDTMYQGTWPCRTDDPYRAIRYLLLRLKHAIDAYDPPAPGVWTWATTSLTSDERLPLEGHLSAFGITSNRYGQMVYHVDFLLPASARYQPKRRYPQSQSQGTPGAL